MANKLTGAGWEFGRDGCAFVSRIQNSSFSFWKAAWGKPPEYWLELKAENYGAKIIYAVVRDENMVGKRPFSSELLADVQESIPSAKAAKWFEALIALKDPAPDWTTAEVLWKLQTDDAFLEKVAKQLLELVRLSDKHVEELVATYGRKPVK